MTKFRRSRFVKIDVIAPVNQFITIISLLIIFDSEIDEIIVDFALFVDNLH